MALIALIDCNNFFASCERVFNPALYNRPLVILSNNDGCIIARSPEAKALGIPMGAPLFKCADLIKKHRVVVYSSNFALYSNMSARVMSIIQHYAPHVEIYSVDEAFLLIPDEITDPIAYTTILQQRIKQWTGIPVSIGIGHTKTMAKIANKIAKRDSAHAGVYDITKHPRIDELLHEIPVGDIWGIGRKSAQLLNSYHIMTARDLKYADDAWIKKQLSIMGLRTVCELRNTPCFSLDEHPSASQSIAHTRSFGTPISSLPLLKEAIADYVAQAAVHMRDQQSRATVMHVFIHTSFFSEYTYYKSTVITLPQPTDYTPDLIAHAQQAVETLYKPGYKYKKAGVILMGFTPADHQQLSVFDQTSSAPSKKQLAMQSIDTINNKWGKRTLMFAAQGTQQPWRAASLKRSPAYTTSWQEIPVTYPIPPAPKWLGVVKKKNNSNE